MNWLDKKLSKECAVSFLRNWGKPPLKVSICYFSVIRELKGLYGAVCGFRWKWIRWRQYAGTEMSVINWVIENCSLFLSYNQFFLPRGLRRRSTAVRLLRSWVRIPPGHGCLSAVSVVSCQVEVSATDWSLVQRSPTDCAASLCVIKKPRKRGG